ncbi:MAG: RNase H family protein [Terriglobales bacterium]
MQLDPHAIHIRTDGSCLQQRGYRSGAAAIVIYPDFITDKPDQILDMGYIESTNQRMELKACIEALRWILNNSPWPGVTRVQVITDSSYVKDNIARAAAWRRNGWRNIYNEPRMNVNLWKDFLSVYATVRQRSRVSVTFHQTKGKKDPYLKEVDKAAKAAAERGGPEIDRGYARGRIVRSALPGVATPLVAKGQTIVIRPYAKKVMARAQGENRMKFDVFSEEQEAFVAKHYAFCSAELAHELHSHHGYRVKCNDNPKYPQIVANLEEVPIPKLSSKQR